MTSTAVSETAQKLKAALELLGPNGENWLQHVYRRGGQFCSTGALIQVAGANFHKLRDAIDKYLDGNTITLWNDIEGRTFADVKAVFKKAIEANL